MSTNLNKIEPSARDPATSALVNNHTEHTVYPTTGYASHGPSPSDGQGGSQDSPIPAPQPLPHGYNHTTPVQNESHIHPELRSSNESVSPSPGYPPVPAPSMMTAALSPSGHHMMSSPLSPVGAPSMGGMDSDNTADGRKAKRELSQSKRAAQNRAAQRAFRQRKEHYIKKLEQQVREYGEMENGYKTIQTENYALREYVIHLQSRLLDTQGEYPQPPPNINLAHPHSQAPPAPVSESQHGSAGSNPLEVAAQAVAGLSRSEHLAASRESYAAKVYEQVRAEEDARTAEEITRQLADGAPDALSTASM